MQNYSERKEEISYRKAIVGVKLSKATELKMKFYIKENFWYEKK